jgi:hypothetical protein
MTHRFLSLATCVWLCGGCGSASPAGGPPAAPSSAASGAQPAKASPGSLLVEAGETELRLTPGDFESLPHEDFTVEGKEGKEELRGVPLHAILARAGVPVGRHRRGHHPVEYVIAEAADGYRALFSLAEIDPALGGSAIYVIDRRGGQPLAAAEGPWRMVVPGDSMRSRWLRQLVALRLRSP